MELDFEFIVITLIFVAITLGLVAISEKSQGA